MDELIPRSLPYEFPIALDPELTSNLLALRRAERVLRRLEARLRNTSESLDVGVASIGADGRLLSVTDGLCEIIGYPAEAVIGARMDEIDHPGDKRVDAELFKKVMGGDLDAYSVEKRFIRRDGGVAECRMSVTLLRDVLHRPMYHVAVIVDIGRQRRLQRVRDCARAEMDRRTGLVDALLRKNATGIVVIDTHTGAILYCNDRTASLLSFPLRATDDRVGYADLLRAIDARRSDGSVYSVEDSPLSLNHVEDDPGWREELVCRSRNGDLVRMTVTSASICDRKGRVVMKVMELQHNV